MKLIIGTDHRGIEYKERLYAELSSLYEIVDLSIGEDKEDDYPDFAFKVSNYVLNEENAFGILICGTGIGMSIAANKVKGIRCGLVHSVDDARLAREHNNANIIAISSKMDIDLAVSCIKTFVSTPFSEAERHHRRVAKIIDYENGEYNEL